MNRPLPPAIAVAAALLAAPAAGADAVDDAVRLLRAADAGSRFTAQAERQARGIIRTYASIVNMSVDAVLPQRIRRAIAECYASVYAWENFAPGIARILADELSRRQLRLLTDFYRSRALPPAEIPTFRDAIARARRVERAAADYIYSNSVGCVERDARLIMDWLGSRDAAPPNGSWNTSGN